MKTKGITNNPLHLVSLYSLGNMFLGDDQAQSGMLAIVTNREHKNVATGCFELGIGENSFVVFCTKQTSCLGKAVISHEALSLCLLIRYTGR